MVEETGIVKAIDGTMATVLVQKKSACDGCTAHGACESTKEGMEIEAFNAVHAHEGQKVKVLMTSGEYLRGTMLIYGFPLVLFVAGAILGKNAGDKYFTDMNSDLIAAFSGFAALILSILGIKILSRKLESNTRFQPVIEEIIE